ncbi:intraflagellar transport protein 70A [Planococcus citri]|uniref:intraflagellar transport protein 70A n=1 Tax=Planococcus citri TaxID=170843 RepID=UPI0031FA429E
MFQTNKRIKEGEYTKTIYMMIKDQNYNEAIILLNNILDFNLNSRAALSLLAYCYFQVQDFVNASNCYEQLTILFPEELHYRIYYAQALYQACLYEEAMKVTNSVKTPSYQKEITKLKAAIKYGQEDITGARSLLELCGTPEEDPDITVNQGSLFYKEGHYEEALQNFTTALTICGYEPHLSYNVALCYYRLKEYTSALKHIGDIIERGIREHPELNVGMTTEGIEVRSVGNTQTLHESALVEAFNLKAAIEYQLKNHDNAREALTDMPPRSEEELDAVTLHNQALMNMDTKPTEGFEKLQFLLQQNPFPAETLGNLLILYCKYEYYDLAADVLAENSHLTVKYLSPYLYNFLDALIIQQSAPDEAYRKFDEIATRQIDLLRKATKTVQEARETRDDETVKKAVVDYEDTLEKYIPVLMAQAKIYWDTENYAQVENIFHKSVEFCNENDTWRLHVAHVLFMQDKFKEATGFYEPLVKKSYHNIINVSAIVLANLCVSYIMTAQNDDAEELMRKLEKEEDRLIYEDPNRKVFHLCIVNLVIGTLYCAKGNYEFGISRIIRSLEPYDKKLGMDTWFYAKRCILSWLENMARHLLFPTDTFNHDVMKFLDHCALHGIQVKAYQEQPLQDTRFKHHKNSVTYEARLLKAILLEILDY